MTELDINLEEVTELALRTGEQIVSLQCPCCGRTFYALKNEAVYEPVNPASQESLIKLKLGRKCPYCGFTGGYVNNSIKDQQVQQMQVEIEAEQLAQDLADKRKTSWSQICSQGPDFNTRGDQ